MPHEMRKNPVAHEKIQNQEYYALINGVRIGCCLKNCVLPKGEDIVIIHSIRKKNIRDALSIQPTDIFNQ